MSDTKQMRSLLESLNRHMEQTSLRDNIETRSTHLVEAVSNLLEDIDATFTDEEAQSIKKRFFSAIKRRDAHFFTESMKRLRKNVERN